MACDLTYSTYLDLISVISLSRIFIRPTHSYLCLAQPWNQKSRLPCWSAHLHGFASKNFSFNFRTKLYFCVELVNNQQWNGLESKTYARGEVWLPPPLWAWYFTKTLLPAQRRLIVFAYFLLVNLSTQCKYHGMNLHADFKENCKWAKK